MAQTRDAVAHAEHAITQILAEGLARAPGLRTWFIDTLTAHGGLADDFSATRLELRPDVFAEQSGYDFALHESCAGAPAVLLVTVAARFEPAVAALGSEACNTARRDGAVMTHTV